jgi:tetratricopeptide (TPR) repeat protein
MLDKEIADAYKKRGIYEQELLQWEKSIKDFTHVLRLHTDAFFMYRVRGVSYYNINQFKLAIDDFTTYLKHDSTNKEITSYRGLAYLKNNQRLNAYVDFALSDSRQMLDFKDMERLVDSVLLIPDTLRALFYLNTITTAVPFFTEGYVQQFKIHLARNDWKPIQNNITNAVRNSRMDAEKSKHSYLLTLQALNFLRLSHEDDALKTFTEAIKFDKKNDFAYLERGKLLLAMGKDSKAESDFRFAYSLGNQNAKELLSTINK